MPTTTTVRETLAERNARYLAEGRTVSGGDGNGPGKPGYKFLILMLTDDWDDDEIALNTLADAGYSFLAFIPDGRHGALLLGNYKKD